MTKIGTFLWGVAIAMTTSLQSYAGNGLAEQDSTLVLHIVETSDVHGSFFPYDFITRQPKAGTLARLSSYVSTLRRQYGDRLVLLDNGDILQGQPTNYYSNFIDTAHANIAAEVVNYLRYDAETMGNHDVEPGHAVYDKWISEVRCPVLGANIIDTRTGQPYVKPYTILNKGGVRVAVIGLLTPAIPNWLSEDTWSGLRFEEMTSAARKWVSVVRQQELADVVIGLFHSGKSGGITTADYEEDASERVAREVPGFDLVLFGHDHTPHCDWVVNVGGDSVLCLDPANNALRVAEAAITLKRHSESGDGLPKWQVAGVSGQLTDITSQPIDTAYMARFADYLDRVKAFSDEKIGTFQSTISSQDCFFGSSAFNDLILNLELKLTGADVALSAPLQFNATIKAGPVTVGDMFNLYKYENQLCVMRLTGEELRRHLEMSYDLWVNTMRSPDDHLLLLDERTQGDMQRFGFKNMTFNFDSAAGIDYEVDVTKPDGHKVKILRMSDGRPFDPKAWYRVAVNSYRANGGGELLTKGAGIPKDSLEGRVIWRSERDQRYYLAEEIRRQKTLDPKPNNNWRFVPKAWTKPAAERDRRLLFGN